jgi:hypothetical protein
MKLKIFIKAVKKSFSPKMINDALLPFLATVGAASLIGPLIPFGSAIELILGLFYFIVFTQIYLDPSDIKRYTGASMLIKKAFNLAVLSIYTGILTVLGFILIVPGIILLKRYLYAGVVCVAEGGDIDWAMKRSKELSAQNGYQTLLSTLVLIIPVLLISFSLNNLALLGFLPPLLQVLASSLLTLLASWLTYTVWFCVVLEGYSDAVVKQSNA